MTQLLHAVHSNQSLDSIGAEQSIMGAVVERCTYRNGVCDGGVNGVLHGDKVHSCSILSNCIQAAALSLQVVAGQQGCIEAAGVDVHLVNEREDLSLGIAAPA